VAEEFAAKFSAALARMTVGDGTREGVQVGPLIDADAVSRIEGLLADASSRGATVLTGGERIPGPGNFLQPTVLTGVPADARMMTEEIFGPVAPITTFETLDEAVALANGSEFGLIAYVYGQDLDETLGVVERLETGMVGLNSGVVSNPAAPFGGVKSSGLGREGSYEGIEEYLETMYVGIGLL
jgi:succinate-semialdehyde dehydrogenase/glutarate-semialdehyde dehydrogenase